jgi:hypothetical protein
LIDDSTINQFHFRLSALRNNAPSDKAPEHIQICLVVELKRSQQDIR